MIKRTEFEATKEPMLATPSKDHVLGSGVSPGRDEQDTAATAPDVLVIESVVDLDRGAVTVESRVLIDPEPLLVTRMLDGATVLEKQHTVLPPAVAAAVVERGVEAARATLQMHHLRYLRRLLSMGTAGTVEPSSVGTLATLVLGPNGEAISRVGEDQVSGSWLRAAYLVTALAAAASEALELGPLVRGCLRSVLGGSEVPDGAEPRLEAHFSRDSEDATGPIRVIYTQNRNVSARLASAVALEAKSPVALFERLVREAVIEAWCGFGDDSGVGDGGALGPNPALATLTTAAATARHLFREAAPPVAAFELRYASCALLFLPWGRGIVVLTTASDDLEAVVGTLLHARERLGIGTVFTGLGERRPSQPPRALGTAPPSPTVEVPTDFRDAVESLLAAVHTAARAWVGGPVIRNYLKRTKGAENAAVDRSEIGLDGRISLPNGGISASDARAYIAWIERFKEAVSSVAPELSTLRLREIAGERASLLVAAQCFDAR